MEIIAEIGQNHNGNIDVAYELIKAAKINGADVAKFQVYDAKKLFSKKGNPWFNYNCNTELSEDDVTKISKYCNDIGIEFMASIFDIERIIWLEKLNVKRYKIASRSINDSNLINAVASTGKPMLVSLGMWHGKQFPNINSKKVSFLYCVSNYPTNLEDIHLKSVDFNIYDGFSDHSIGMTASKAAFARGAKIVEKHFTLDKSMYGPDHECSMTPNELHDLSSYRNELKKCL